MRIEVVGEPSFRTRVRRFVLAGGALAWLTAFVLSGVLESTYVAYPREPDPTNSLTVPCEVKGIVVYITEGQNTHLRWLRWTKLGAGAVILLSLLGNLKPSPRPIG